LELVLPVLLANSLSFLDIHDYTLVTIYEYLAAETLVISAAFPVDVVATPQ
jgi:hypothetical protein